MRRSAFTALLALASGCVLTLEHAIMLDRNDESITWIEGTWVADENGFTAEITRRSGGLLKVALTDSLERTGEFYGAVGRIGEVTVLELEPEQLELDRPDEYTAMFLAGKVQLIVEGQGDSLVIRGIDFDRMNMYLEEHPASTPSRVADQQVVLTGTAEEVQEFLNEYLARPGVLDDGSTWIRKGP